MTLEFCNVTLAPLAGFTAAAPGGAIVGLVGNSGSGIPELLRVGAGWEWLEEGEVKIAGGRRHVGVLEELDLSPVEALFIDHALGRLPALARLHAFAGLESLRRAGSVVLIASHEQELLLRLCDEIWWLEEGKLVCKGDPREVLDAFNRRTAERFREETAGAEIQLHPSMRRGDGRAELLSVETLGPDGRIAMALVNGEEAVVRVRVRFGQDVADPVVGIMIRTRIGMEVYGTNTELEGLKLGPRKAGDTITVDYRFRVDLCPREYTLTAASHDPDGVWHDWAEDAVAFSVAGARYTAGVADLRAKASFSADAAGG